MAGVVLDEPVGKNNGTVKGEAYFACEPKHGLLVRPVRQHTVCCVGRLYLVLTTSLTLHPVSPLGHPPAAVD